MKRKINSSIIIVLMTLMASSASVIAQPGMHGQNGPGQRPGLGIPDLTEEQKGQIKDLQTTYLKDIQPLKNELKINKAKLDALTTTDNPNMNEINKLIDENGKIFTELRKKQVAHKLDVRNLLSDEQKVYFDNTGQRMRHAARGEMERPGIEHRMMR